MVNNQKVSFETQENNSVWNNFLEKSCIACRATEKFFAKWDKKEIDKLETGEQIKKYENWIRSVQWSVRGFFVGFAIGGESFGSSPWISTVPYVVVEAASSSFQVKVENKKEKWKEFSEEFKSLTQKYEGLLVISSISSYSQTSASEQTKELLRILRDKIEKFMLIKDEVESKSNWEETKNRLKEVSESIHKLQKELGFIEEESEDNKDDNLGNVVEEIVEEGLKENDIQQYELQVLVHPKKS